MVRYSTEHKARSRAAIVDSAARLFRKHGYKGVGIDELCAEAGLTRGAFYAHFKSKAELFSEVMGGSHDMVRRLSERKAEKSEQLLKAGAAIARDYLHENHRQGVLGGCSLASLAMDTVRAEPEAQAAYAAAVEQVTAEFRRGSNLSKERAQAALALCVGGLLIGSACGDNRIGNQVARAARKQVQELLEESG